MLPSRAVKRIHKALESLFATVKAKLLGTSFGQVKGIEIKVSPAQTLPGLYEAAAEMAGAHPNPDTSETLKNIAASYLDAQLAVAKAKVVHDISATLQEAKAGGIKTDVATVLGGRLADTWGTITAGVKRIAESEATAGRNLGTLEGITKTAALQGVEDPTVCFIPVKDNLVCPVCIQIHLLPDGVTPRAFKLSEVSGGYHKKGDNIPCMSGLHPHDRCVLTSIPTNWGFEAGKLKFISLGHDEYAKQRGL